MKLLGGTLIALVIFVGCGSDSSATPSDGGVSADGAPIAPPAPVSTPVGGKALEGVFVSASKGIDGADGSLARPVRTIAAGLEIAKSRPGLPINVCAETYTESVKLLDGVTMFGYYDCSTAEWRRVANHAFIVSPTSPAAVAENLTLPAKFEGFDVSAPDIGGLPVADAPVASSYGFVIKGSKNLALADVTLRGGNGQAGLDGTNPASNNSDTGGKQNGGNAKAQRPCTAGATCFNVMRVAGSAGGTSACAVGSPGAPGGQGGDGPFLAYGAYRVEIGAAADGRPNPATADTAAGAPTSGLASNTPGQSGAPGGAGGLGQSGAWSFTAEGFAPGNATAGTVGSPGRGGGGGAGTTVWWTTDTLVTSPPQSGQYYGLAGAGGGAGGCGGLPGTGGAGGGASIGLLVVASDVTITDARVEGRKGGRGGKGALGLAGVSGGFAGTGKVLPGQLDTGIYGSPGGAGGAGGPAGVSGHGAPGPSIAMAFTGTRPQTAKVDLVPGDPGEGQPAVTQNGQTLPATVGIAKAEHGF